MHCSCSCDVHPRAASQTCNTPQHAKAEGEDKEEKTHKAQRCTSPPQDLMHAPSKLSWRLQRLPWALDKNWVYRGLLSVTEGRPDLLLRNVHKYVMGSGYATNTVTEQQQEVGLASFLFHMELVSYSKLVLQSLLGTTTLLCNKDAVPVGAV